MIAVSKYGIQNYYGDYMAIDILKSGINVFNTEIEAVEKTKNIIGDTFVKIVNKVYNCKGKVIITGMGKPGHIGTKVAATFSSLGISSFFLHPAEAQHGDLGMIQKDDLVIAMSYSGESSEIVKILPNIRKIGAFLIGITANSNSSLKKYSDICEVFPKFDEACHLGLAPTSSTTTYLVYCDAIGVVVSQMKNFKKNDFGLFHPAGSLGKKLIYTVTDLMDSRENNAVVMEHSTLKDAIFEMSEKGLGIITVINKRHEIVGILTDGCIKRAIENNVDIYNEKIDSYIVRDVIYINDDAMAVDALKIMEENNINSMPVLRGNIVVGVIRKIEIKKIGIYL